MENKPEILRRKYHIKVIAVGVLRYSNSPTPKVGVLVFTGHRQNLTHTSHLSPHHHTQDNTTQDRTTQDNTTQETQHTIRHT